MTPKTDAQPDARTEAQSLDRRYGKIGIPAVLAALPYQSDVKNLAYAPVTPAMTNGPLGRQRKALRARAASIFR